MQFKIEIGPWNLLISEELYNELRDAISKHETEGFRDGSTRLGRVTITEVAAEGR